MYLTDLLLEKGYEVYAQYRQDQDASNSAASFPDSLLKRSKFRPIIGSAANPEFTYSVVKDIRPDEIYYLASNHELDYSLDNFVNSRAINLDGLAGVLSALTDYEMAGRLFYASSSNIFYNSSMSPQNEETPHSPSTLYGFFKSSAMSLISMYRAQFGVYACSGILYNHESPMRKEFFLPKKIVSTAVAIKQGKKVMLHIGDIHALRDWGYAGDFVRAMWMILQAKHAQDYIVGTGVLHSVEWVMNHVFSELGLDWRQHVVIDPALLRSTDSSVLRADISRIKSDLGWHPEIEFQDALKMMIKNELEK
jgi:GDPmannose 4,6-dehydratase